MAKDVRQNLRDTAEEIDLAGFFREAVSADKACRKCREPIPDWSARSNVIKLMLEQGYGRAPAQDDKPPIDLQDNAAAWTAEQRAHATQTLRTLLARHGHQLAKPLDA